MISAIASNVLVITFSFLEELIAGIMPKDSSGVPREFATASDLNVSELIGIIDGIWPGKFNLIF